VATEVSREAVLEAERRGELLMEFDLADRALAEHPDDQWMKHRAVLALARMGSTGEAARRFVEFGLSGVEDEDVAALEARIAKDQATAAGGGFAAAGALYEAIFRRTGGYYPAVNAATLYLLGLQTERATELAREAQAALERSGDDSYYAAATEAEIAFVLRDLETAEDALRRARKLNAQDYSALATTRRQLRLLVEFTGDPEDLLEPLSGPAVLHYCGHRIGGRFPAEDIPHVAGRIAHELERVSPGFGYGALANGADILCAEELLRRGVELHVILPFARDEFVHASVADGGDEWVARFDACIEAAKSVTYATDDALRGEDVLFRYGTELAMGTTLQRATWLDAPAVQLAIWDGETVDRTAGTAIDVAAWQATGHSSIIVRPPHAVPPDVEAAPADDPAGRVVRSLLFADVRKFSTLTDEQLPRFNSVVMAALGRVLDDYDDAIDYKNTWGDALYVVMRDAQSAAPCATDLQTAMKSIDLEAHGLPAHLALRLGAHIGPVFPTRDAVLGGDAFMGSHVSRTARIEPVTPPGAVYATDAFAAALALARSDFACEYVGHMPTAKNYGRFRMFSVRAPVKPEDRQMSGPDLARAVP
jgi:class 3 adenylate cyclase